MHDLRTGRGYNDVSIGLVYWGMESGSDDVLKYVNKGCTGSDVLSAARFLRSSIECSVMVMPGLGGINHSESHAYETAKALSRLNPKFLTFMGINPCHSSPYARKMAKEVEDGQNRPLTDREMALQIRDILSYTDSYALNKVGCFPPEVDGVGCNPFPFGSVDIRGNPENKVLIMNLITSLAHLLNDDKEKVIERARHQRAK